MPEPRVIFVNRVYWPSTAATAQLLTDVAEGLAARGWAVHVVAASEASTRHEGVTIHRTGTPEQHGGLLSRAWNHRGFLRGARRQLAALLQPGDLVVALTDPPLLGLEVAAAAAARGARCVHWIQDIYPEIAAVHFGPLIGLFLRGLQRRRDRAWQGAAACVTLGEDMAAFVAGHGVAPDRIHLFPNWAPRELDVPPAPAAVAARRSQGGDSGEFVVAYSGNLGRVHEFATVLDAADRLRAAPVAFHFIGRGARFAAVAAAARRRGLDRVRLLPPEPRAGLAAALAAADAHLVTLQPAYASLVFPSKLAGVLAAGRPALFVGPPGGDIARLLQRAECGAAFAPGEGAALAATIERWRTDRALAARLGGNARRAYESAFRYETALENWDRLLRGLTVPA